MINENPLTDTEREIMAKHSRVTSYGDPLPRKRSSWFAKLLSSIENENRRRLRKAHASVIAAVSMNLVTCDIRNNASDTGYETTYTIGNEDITTIIETLIEHGVVGYDETFMYVLMVTPVSDVD